MSNCLIHNYAASIQNWYKNGPKAKAGIGAYLRLYNDERPHQALNYQTPRQLFEAEGQAWPLISGLGLEPNSVVLVTSNAAGHSLNLASSLSS